MKNISKSFPGVRALQGVDFKLCEGEVHALMGENGAGKSTLIKVLTGVYAKDEGHIFVDGNDKEVSIHSPQDAQRVGISTVYQEITLCPNLSVAENMYIGRSEGAGTNWKKMNEDADKLLQSLDIPAKATQQLASCSIAVQQMVAIARAVDMDCKILILDDPFSAVDMKTEKNIIDNLRANYGDCLILLISHRLAIFKYLNQIILINEDKTLEYGNHQKLIENSKLYNQLYLLQQRKESD